MVQSDRSKKGIQQEPQKQSKILHQWIMQFVENMQTMTKENKKGCEILRSFDQIIHHKATKASTSQRLDFD